MHFLYLNGWGFLFIFFSLCAVLRCLFQKRWCVCVVRHDPSDPLEKYHPSCQKGHRVSMSVKYTIKKGCGLFTYYGFEKKLNLIKYCFQI